MTRLANVFAFTLCGVLFACGRSNRASDNSSRRPTLPPALSVRAATPPLPLPPASLCNIVTRLSTTIDWVRTLGAVFPIERGGRWALIRIHRPGSALAEVRQLMDTTYLEGHDALISCDTFVLLWKACDTCVSSDDTPRRIAKRVGKTDVLTIFEYGSNEAIRDCLDDRLPRERCRRWFRRAPTIADCGADGREERFQTNKVLIHLGLVPPGSRACLNQYDLHSLQPIQSVPPQGTVRNAPASSDALDPWLLP
jgi:hypothetical protein